MASRRWMVPLVVAGAVLLYRRIRHSAASERAKIPWEFSGPMARLYDLLFSSVIDRFYERVARHVTRTTPAGKILDVGCGPGRLSMHLANATSGLTVTGIDISPDMIELAKQRAGGSIVTRRLDFQVADVCDLPFPENEFDLVVSTLSMHHWPDPVRGLAEIRRVLKPTGQAYIYDVADWFLRLTHHGTSHREIMSEAPFVIKEIGTEWSVGRVPLVTRFALGR